jgi:hypothetical protein
VQACMFKVEGTDDFRMAGISAAICSMSLRDVIICSAGGMPNGKNGPHDLHTYQCRYVYKF